MLPRPDLWNMICLIVSADFHMKIQVWERCSNYSKILCNYGVTDEYSIFQKYSQAGCIFECSLKFAIESVGCLPWDFPVPSKWQDVHLAVCNSTNPNPINDKNKLVLFYEAMNNDSNLRTCECMPDCEATVYDTQGNSLVYFCHMYFTTYFLCTSGFLCSSHSKDTMPKGQDNV